MANDKNPAGPRRVHINALDVLRGVAVLIVMGFHYSFNLNELPTLWARAINGLFEHGIRGVDLFFVLSGFLITGILMDSRAGKNYFQAFWMRRVLRIFPVYFLYLAIVCGIYKLFHNSEFSHTNIPFYFLFISNWASNLGIDDPYLGHLWSLAVEEQFYFVWPFLVKLCPPKQLLIACLAVVIASLVGRQIAFGRVSNDLLYRGTPFRIEGLAIGAVVAVVVRDKKLRELARKVVLPMAILSLGVWYLCRHTDRQFTFGWSAISLFFGTVVFMASQSRSEWRFASPLRAIGRVSYGMYVYHIIIGHFCLSAIRWAFPTMPLPKQSLTLMCVATPCTYLVALASFHWVENRFLKLKGMFKPDYRSSSVRSLEPVL